MSKREGFPLKLINTTLGPKEVEFKHKQHARFGRGPLLPGADDFLKACAMVDTALDWNEAITPLWLDIIDAWNKPGCAAYCETFLRESDNLQKLESVYQEDLLKPETITVIKALAELVQAYNDSEWRTTFQQDPDIINMIGIMDNFILKAFNGPTKPLLQNRWGSFKDRPVPKYKVRVTPDKTRPELKQAIAFLSWCAHEDIDLREVDRERMGADYEVVMSGQKPSTVYGRKRKREINETKRNAGLSFISDKAIYSGAEKWYCAKVIRGSIVDATSDYEINNPSTFSRLIKPFNNIAGLR